VRNSVQEDASSMGVSEIQENRMDRMATQNAPDDDEGHPLLGMTLNLEP
jgi:hypothetical protein